MPSTKVLVFLMPVILALAVGCSNPEKKVIGLWTGSAEVKPPSTGNPQIDAQLAQRGPQTMGCNLTLNEDKSYAESLPGYQIVGSWTLSGNTITLSPRTVNGLGVDATKKKVQEAQAKANVSVPMPGLNGSEQATVASDAKTITVTLFNSPITLRRATEGGTS